MADLFSADVASNLEEIKRLLDSNFVKDKMQAMKALMAIVSSGQDASVFYSDVVKNVVTPSVELKKLVYLFLTHYADVNQELALLSINNFQKDLADQNPMVRGLALRAMSSVRVHMIVPLVAMSIKERCIDGSPYVRKIAALAIPKVYSLDHEQKPAMVDLITRLLQDRSTLVLGCAVHAFVEVCPERLDLIDSCFHRLLAAVVDMEEWGQISTLSLLTRYARTQFEDPRGKAEPNLYDEKRFYKDEDEGGEDHDSAKDGEENGNAEVKEMDPDHRLLLQNSKLLLHSRNSGVVLAVVALYHALAPSHEMRLCVRPLVRLLHSHKEVQFVVLSNILSLLPQHTEFFTPFLRHFFVLVQDSRRCRSLKLAILVRLISDANARTVLQEFETYTQLYESDFVAETVQALAQSAGRSSMLSTECMQCLLGLLSSPRKVVVAECVVAIRSLLARHDEDKQAVVQWLAGLIDEIKLPVARASIVWCAGEYASLIPDYAPDVVRIASRHFAKEDDGVKLAVINAAAKLYIRTVLEGAGEEGGDEHVGAKEIPALLRFVLEAAGADPSYDIRDRARLVRRLLLGAGKNGEDGPVASSIASVALIKRLLMAEKPAPRISTESRETFVLGTLSHITQHAVFGYEPLPPFPEQAPDPAKRRRPASRTVAGVSAGGGKQDKGFFEEEEDDEDESDEEESDEEESDEDDEEDEDDSDEEESDEEESDDDDSERGATTVRIQPATCAHHICSPFPSFGCLESRRAPAKKAGGKAAAPAPAKKAAPAAAAPPAQSGADLDLLSLFASDSTPSGAVLAPAQNNSSAGSNATFPPSPALPAASTVLLNRLSAMGLQVEYEYSRVESVSPSLVPVRLRFENFLQTPITNISMSADRAEGLQPFEPIASLPPNATQHANVYIDFQDKKNPVRFTISTDAGSFPVSVTPLIGELVTPFPMSYEDFAAEQKKLGGMHENSRQCAVVGDASALVPLRVWRAAHVASVPSPDASEHCYAGKSVSGGSLVLVKVVVGEDQCKCTVNTANALMGVMLLDEIKKSLTTK